MLVLGPLLRYVDDTSATVWVETSAAAEVTVTAERQQASARTFAAHGHHYALVEITGLEPGSRSSYTVAVDGEPVWPATDPDLAAYPPPVISTLLPGKPLRIAFGSCRVSVPHDAEGIAEFGVDALRAYALSTAALSTAGRTDPSPDDGQGHGEHEDARWPDLVLFLGDQVYADETSAAMRRFIEERRDPDQGPGYEIKDFEEYAHLYRLAWRDPAIRWLLSTVPSAMIFDDHDIRDDWNSSRTWRRTMAETAWWHDRIVGGLGSYWIYQHLGNLGPEERQADELWKQIARHAGPDELDVTDQVDALADRADAHPETYRWSYSRDFDTQARLVVVDSRAARQLEPERRSMLDDGELMWLDAQLRGDVDHLLIGTSLPFLLAPGLHHIESFGEAIAEGAWGRPGKWLGERARESADLEHWAAFQRGFRDVAEIVLEVAGGRRGRAPQTVTFLSGDVHHSYVAEAWPRDHVVASRIIQAVCSPIRNPLPGPMKGFIAVASRRFAGTAGRLLSLAGRVRLEPLRWKVTHGPWYDNNLAVLELGPTGPQMHWYAGEVAPGGDPERPGLTRVASL